MAPGLMGDGRITGLPCVSCRLCSRERSCAPRVRAGSDRTPDTAEHAAKATGSTVPLQVPALPLSLPSDVSVFINPVLLFRKHRQRPRALLEVTSNVLGQQRHVSPSSGTLALLEEGPSSSCQRSVTRTGFPKTGIKTI